MGRLHSQQYLQSEWKVCEYILHSVLLGSLSVVPQDSGSSGNSGNSNQKRDPRPTILST